MRHIVVVSGKGGTGKTTVVAGWATLAGSVVTADCDVDAPNLHLLLRPEVSREGPFEGLPGASITGPDCTSCDLCRPLCAFGAIRIDENGRHEVDTMRCEGCGLCALICPQKAIVMRSMERGRWYVSTTRVGTFVHARLAPAEENSGKLVSLVKSKAQQLAEKEGADYLLVDGAPGIGCSVIASLSNADMVVAVAEPTLSGVGDVERVLELAHKFELPTGLIVNKWDLNPRISRNLARHCRKEEGPNLLGRIPFDKAIPRSMAELKTITEYEVSPASQALARTWENLNVELKKM